MARPDGKKTSFGASFVCAGRGIAEAAKGRNFKIECLIGAVALMLCCAFGVQAHEWLAVIVCIGLVLGLECVNTAFESLVDLASPEMNPLAGKAKDCAAGAALVASLASLFVAAIIFIPYILHLFT